MFPAWRKSCIRVSRKQTSPLSLHVLQTAKQLVVGVLDGSVLVVGQVWQWRSVLRQRVVTRV